MNDTKDDERLRDSSHDLETDSVKEYDKDEIVRDK